jgi:hypothetical protein
MNTRHNVLLVVCAEESHTVNTISAFRPVPRGRVFWCFDRMPTALISATCRAAIVLLRLKELFNVGSNADGIPIVRGCRRFINIMRINNGFLNVFSPTVACFRPYIFWEVAQCRWRCYKGQKVRTASISSLSQLEILEQDSCERRIGNLIKSAGLHPISKICKNRLIKLTWCG